MIEQTPRDLAAMSRAYETHKTDLLARDVGNLLTDGRLNFFAGWLAATQYRDESDSAE